MVESIIALQKKKKKKLLEIVDFRFASVRKKIQIINGDLFPLQNTLDKMVKLKIYGCHTRKPHISNFQVF